jgi:hypothetical protein
MKVKVGTLPVVSSPGQGIVRITKTVTPKGNGHTREENDAQAVQEQTTVVVPAGDVSNGAHPSNTAKGVAKWSIRLGFSEKFQSVHIEGGIELPITVDTTDLAGSSRAGLDLAEDIVSEKMAEQIPEATSVLRRIIQTVGR